MLSEYEKTDDAMIVFACLLLVSVWLLPVKGKAISEQRGVTQLVKFVAAIVVVLGHQVVFYCKTLPSTFSAEIPSGALCVAFFLFMSGYGLMYGQLKRNERLTSKWLKKRMPKLIVPALTAMVFYLAVAVSLGKDMVWMDVVKYGFLSHQNLPYGWYVTEILLLYLTFWLAFRYLRKEYALYDCCLSNGSHDYEAISNLVHSRFALLLDGFIYGTLGSFKIVCYKSSYT